MNASWLRHISANPGPGLGHVGIVEVGAIALRACQVGKYRGYLGVEIEEALETFEGSPQPTQPPPTSFLVDAQYVFKALSNPFAKGWNLLGARDMSILTHHRRLATGLTALPLTLLGYTMFGLWLASKPVAGCEVRGGLRVVQRPLTLTGVNPMKPHRVGGAKK